MLVRRIIELAVSARPAESQDRRCAARNLRPRSECSASAARRPVPLSWPGPAAGTRSRRSVDRDSRLPPRGGCSRFRRRECARHVHRPMLVAPVRPAHPALYPRLRVQGPLVQEPGLQMKDPLDRQLRFSPGPEADARSGAHRRRRSREARRMDKPISFGQTPTSEPDVRGGHRRFGRDPGLSDAGLSIRRICVTLARETPSRLAIAA